MIFKRKSFRKFNTDLKISEKELIDIEEKINNLIPLDKYIKVDYKIVPKEQTTCKRGEYCLLIFSEEKENYLKNIGYMFEQLDLYLASKNIGVCWYGMGKTSIMKFGSLKYVIMLAIGKSLESEFRKDYTKAKRKKTSDIWCGDFINEIGDVVKYSPSACNTQPWKVVCQNNILKVYRTKVTKCIIPKNKISFYNSIDIGTFLLFLDITLAYNNICYEKKLITASNNLELMPVAEYILN